MHPHLDLLCGLEHAYISFLCTPIFRIFSKSLRFLALITATQPKRKFWGGYEQSVHRGKSLQNIKDILLHSWSDSWKLYRDAISHLTDGQKAKSLSTHSAGEAVETCVLTRCSGMCKRGQPLWKTIKHHLSKLKMCSLSFDPGMPLLIIYPIDMPASIQDEK